MTTPEPKNFLFICTGNTCRSLMAQKLLETLASSANLPWGARSCGIAAERFYQVPPAVRKVLAAHGVPSFEHTAQLVSRDLLRWADVSLAMAEEHREETLDRFPEFSSKVHLFRPFAGFGEPASIDDPIGQSYEVFEACGKLIRESVEALINNHGTNRKPAGKTGS